MFPSGILPVLQLPYRDDESIDEATLRREVDWVFDQGADGVTVAMVTEILRMTDEERTRVARVVVEATAGRGPVIMSVGAESTHQALRHLDAAVAAGVDAVMAIPPVSHGCLPGELEDYFRALIGAADLPVIVQDASGYVGEAIPIGLQAAIYASAPDRVAFKPEALPLGPNLSRLRAACGPEVAIYEGSGGIGLVDAWHRGIAGTMPGAEIIWAIRALWDALASGDEERARGIHGGIAPLISLQTGIDGFLLIEKHLLQRQGIFANTLVRGPVGFALDDPTIREVDRLLAYLKARCGVT